VRRCYFYRVKLDVTRSERLGAEFHPRGSNRPDRDRSRGMRVIPNGNLVVRSRGYARSRCDLQTRPPPFTMSGVPAAFKCLRDAMNAAIRSAFTDPRNSRFLLLPPVDRCTYARSGFTLGNQINRLRLTRVSGATIPLFRSRGSSARVGFSRG